MHTCTKASTNIPFSRRATERLVSLDTRRGRAISNFIERHDDLANVTLGVTGMSSTSPPRTLLRCISNGTAKSRWILGVTGARNCWVLGQGSEGLVIRRAGLTAASDLALITGLDGRGRIDINVGEETFESVIRGVVLIHRPDLPENWVSE
jgi:hypothetical protein